MKAILAILVAVLFALLFVAIHAGLEWGIDRSARRRRLRIGRERREPAFIRVEALRKLRDWKPYGHIADVIAAVGVRMTPEAFAVVSLLLGAAGAVLGALLFPSFRSVLLLALMLGLIPYCWLRIRLVNRQMATRLEFLPAMELFYQCYLVTGRRHIRTALQKTVEERRLPGEVQAVFEQLYRHLCVGGDDEESLRRFALSVGNVWADYFCSIVKVALTEGNDVSDNLRELVDDMRKTRLEDQAERNKLLEIRIANFTPALFLLLFLGINFRMNPESSYLYYVADPAGRSMLLQALAMMFGSFLMGLYLSRRRL